MKHYVRFVIVLDIKPDSIFFFLKQSDHMASEDVYDTFMVLYLLLKLDSLTAIFFNIIKKTTMIFTFSESHTGLTLHQSV